MRQLLLCISSSHCGDPRAALAAHASCYPSRGGHLLSLLRAPPRPALILRLPPFTLLSTSHVKNFPGERVRFVSLSLPTQSALLAKILEPGHLQGHHWPIHWFFSSSFISRPHSHFQAPCPHQRQPL